MSTDIRAFTIFSILPVVPVQVSSAGMMIVGLCICFAIARSEAVNSIRPKSRRFPSHSLGTGGTGHPFTET
jgi:hypothetical protein